MLSTAWLYFIIVFSFAFVLGIARNLVIAPQLGETLAVWLEISTLLALSWVIARRLIRKRVFTVLHRLSIGAIAFMLTMISEAGLADLIRGQSLVQWATDLTKPLHLVGLMGQVGFALMPVSVGRR